MSILFMGKKCTMLKFLHHLAFRLLLLSAVVIASFSACGSSSNPSKQEMAEKEHFEQAFVNAQENADFQRLLNLAKQYYEVSRKGHSEYFQIRAASIYGQVLTVMGKGNEAKPLLDQALSTAIQLNSDSLQAELYNGLAMYETLANGNDFAAIEYYIKAIEKLPKDDKLIRMPLLSNLTNSMTAIHDTTSRYAIESYELSKELGGSYEISGMVHMAEVYYNRKQYQQARELLKKAYKTVPPSILPEVDMLMVKVLMATRQFEDASRYADHAIAVADTCKEIQPKVRKGASISKAEVLSQIGKYEESNRWLDKTMADTTDLTSGQKWEINHLYTINYEHLGHYKEALECSKQLKELTLAQTNLDRVKIQKAKEIALDLAQKDAEIEHHRDYAHMMEWSFWGLLVFCLLLSGASAYIYCMYRKQRKLMTVVVERAQPGKEIEEENQKKMDNRHVELFRRMKEVVDDNKMFLDVNLSRESLAKHLGTNRTYISEAVSQMTGMNFPQYVNFLRINEAERRLHDPQVDVSNFANFGRTLGFASLNAFRTAFKQQTGMTLSAYREIARK